MKSNLIGREANLDQRSSLVAQSSGDPILLPDERDGKHRLGEEEIILDETFDPKQIRPIGKYEDMTMTSDEHVDRSQAEFNDAIDTDAGGDEDTLNPTTQ
jgi:hypothetical protein